jgi:predicted HD phosphohydrolase
VQLRKWDEAAKEPHMERPGLEHYRPMLARHLAAQQPASA